MSNPKAEEHVLRSLKVSLTKLKNGDSRDYNRIVKALEASPISTLIFWFISLIKCISLVNIECTCLIQTLLRYKYDAGENTNNAFEIMIVNLISCNHQFIPIVCDKLIKDFLPPQIEDRVITQNDLTGPHAEKIVLKILSISPTLAGYILESLVHYFPNKIHSLLTIDQYIMHIFSLSNYSKIIRNRCLDVIIRFMIEIDAEISIPDEQDDLFFDLDESLGNEPEKLTSTQALEMAEKLDSIMNRTFNFISQQNNNNQLDDIFNGLLKVFNTSILPTRKLKHPQFLIFFICSKNSLFPQRFLGYLIQNTTDIKSSQFIKEISLGYIGSYIARAKYITPTLIHSTLKTLCNWANVYINEYKIIGDYDKHSIFYHLCQAIFYMFCFRFEQILDRTTKVECLSTFKLIEIIQSTLNPFKYCNPIVVREFYETCKDVSISQLIKTCEQVIKSNNSIISQNTVIHASFPFDPYLLKHSSEWISDIYYDWEDRLTKESHSEDNISDLALSTSYNDDMDIIMSFTPDGSYDINAYFSKSPIQL